MQADLIATLSKFNLDNEVVSQKLQAHYRRLNAGYDELFNKSTNQQTRNKLLSMSVDHIQE